MDQRIFDQLDRLEQGARIETRTRREDYNNDSAQKSAYDGHRGHSYGHERDYQQTQNDFVDQPMILDSFDEQLLRQRDDDSRYRQASTGRARLSMMPEASHQALQPSRSSLDLSRFALDTNEPEGSSSDSFHHPLSSSPAFQASQRRPAGNEYGISRDHSFSRRAAHQPGYRTGYQPETVQQLEEEEEKHMRDNVTGLSEAFRPNYMPSQVFPRSKEPKMTAPVVQGIALVSTHELPDRFRSIFPFPLFNAVQSKSFDTTYRTNNNFVLSAPTGSGKTAIMELAICRLVNGFANGSFKIVYQAPTKSLCSERQRDWQAKFGPLDLQCAELTGDTDNAQLRNVQHATIIVTTPEKWDSMTRKWKDHQKLMQMVKLFLIDEVHMLKDDRGATLEAVVSRMKSVGSDVRFVALSATVPNSEDIATWLGKDPVNPHLPAIRERFGEEFRPVRLQKHVYGYQSPSNEFAFDKLLNTRLPDVISKWSQRKPIMIFCFTRAACVDTAKQLANWWATNGPTDRYWLAPRKTVVVADKDLRGTVLSGVAFHHAGLEIQDRTAVEKGYLEGDIGVICCTSTLAVGVNLPCHMVIVKNTVTYQNPSASGCKEYSDLEIMQMLGRAGRPQFDDSAVAVIMTRSPRVQLYEKMISGQEVLESCLHRNLIDHLNAEIGLGTVTNASSAKKWLTGTFLYVRLKENPDHYKLDGDAPGRNLEERLENICSKGIAMLEQNDLVRTVPKLQCTEFGDAMARYYLQFETMKVFLALPPQAKISEILSAISQAAEFKDIRFRAGEKSTYKDLNKNSSMKFPIPVNLDPPAHKVSLIIQSVLGAIELPTEDSRQRKEYTTGKLAVFQHVHRLIRCIIDCQLYLDDAVTARNALMLARSFGAQVWDDSPLHMMQLEGVGLVSVRKLAVVGIRSIEDIESNEPRRLEHVLSRNPPFGDGLQKKAKTFPRLRVSLKMVGEPYVKRGEHVAIKVKAEIGFLNEIIPETFNRKAVYVCLLAETSDGHKVHFARISAKKLNKGQDVLFTCELVSATQTVRAYVMCDEIAGTARSAILQPGIPATSFPSPKAAEHATEQQNKHVANSSKGRASASKPSAVCKGEDEFGDAGLDDTDLVLAENDGFRDIDDFDIATRNRKSKETIATLAPQRVESWEPTQLLNGKWACNHACKDKDKCKHLCCREGLDKRPKPPKAKESKKSGAEPAVDSKQTRLDIGASKKANLPSPAASSVCKTRPGLEVEKTREERDLLRLHNSVMSTRPRVPTIRTYGNATGRPPSSAQLSLGFPSAPRNVKDEKSESDYGNDGWDSNDVAASDSPRKVDRAGNTKQDSTSYSQDNSMLDGEFPSDAGLEVSPSLSAGPDNKELDLSSYSEDFVSDKQGALQKTCSSDHETMSGALPDIANESGLFVSDEISTAGHGLPGELEANRKRLRGTEQNLRDPYAKLAAQPALKKQKTLSRAPSAQLHEDIDRALSVEMDHSFTATALGAYEAQTQAQPGSEEDLKRWFEAEFGTEHFNFVD